MTSTARNRADIGKDFARGRHKCCCLHLQVGVPVAARIVFCLPADSFRVGVAVVMVSLVRLSHMSEHFAGARCSSFRPKWHRLSTCTIEWLQRKGNQLFTCILYRWLYSLLLRRNSPKGSGRKKNAESAKTTPVGVPCSSGRSTSS